MEFSVWLAMVALFMSGGLTPGPAVMFVMSTALQRGFWAGFLSGWGIAAANLLWIALAALGAGAVAAAFPTVFAGLKLVGLAFVIWLAWNLAFQDQVKLDSNAVSMGNGLLFLKGVGLQLSNPNALIFFGGLLPAYFDPARDLSLQIVVATVSITATEMVGLTIYAAMAELLSRNFANPVFTSIFNKIASLVMVSATVFAVWFTF